MVNRWGAVAVAAVVVGLGVQAVRNDRALNRMNGRITALAEMNISLKQQIQASMREEIDQASSRTKQWIENDGQSIIGQSPNYIPELPQIVWQEIGDNKIKTYTGDLAVNVDILGTMAMRVIPIDHPVGHPPFSPPKNYQQDFAPFVMAQSLTGIASNVRAGQPLDGAAVDRLVRDLKRFTNKRGEVFYSFDLDYRGHTIPAGWTSAFGNAMAVIGFTDLYSATRLEEFKALAALYAEPLAKVGGVTRLDAANFLWFDEVPPANGEPVGIFNGHNAAILALYFYGERTGDRQFDAALRAGIATAARYLPMSRRPGKIPRYAQYDGAEDYGPLRAYNQVLALAKITGHPTFKRLAEGLIADIPLR